MTQKEKDKLDAFIDEVREWKEHSELRFIKGDAKMDRILATLEDDPNSSSKGLISRTNAIDKVILDLKAFIDSEKRKRTIQERVFGGVLASIITSVIVYVFKK
jgi:hypothetical protein